MSEIDPYIYLRKGICNGCFTLMFIDAGEKFYCSIKPKKEEAICPCSDCLIKSVCEDECSKLYFFHHF